METSSPNRGKNLGRKASAAIAAASLLTLAAGQAAADTYAIVVNATPQPISVGGSSLAPKLGTWTPLDSHIVLGDGTIAAISDKHKKCKDGGWLIEATGKTKTSMCIQLGFAEIGCIIAAVSVDKATRKERIDMAKTSGTACANRWWDTSGKSIITETADRLIKVQENAVQLVGALAGKV